MQTLIFKISARLPLTFYQRHVTIHMYLILITRFGIQIQIRLVGWFTVQENRLVGGLSMLRFVGWFIVGMALEACLIVYSVATLHTVGGASWHKQNRPLVKMSR